MDVADLASASPHPEAAPWPQPPAVLALPEKDAALLAGADPAESCAKDAAGAVGGEAAPAEPAAASSDPEAPLPLQTSRAEDAAAAGPDSKRGHGVLQAGALQPEQGAQGGAGGQAQEDGDEVCDLVDSTDDEAEQPGPGPAGPGAGADVGGGGGGGGLGLPLAQQLAGLKCRYPPDEAKHSVEVTGGDLAKLEPRQFLNDTCIDFYIKWVLVAVRKPKSAQCLVPSGLEQAGVTCACRPLARYLDTHCAG